MVSGQLHINGRVTLGHASPATTYNYIEADLKMKADCVAMLKAPPSPVRRRRAQYPRLLAFLEAL